MALIWQKGVLRVSFVRVFFCLLNSAYEVNISLTFPFIVEDYIPLKLSPIFPVRGKSVRLAKQGMCAGALAIHYKNTRNKLQRQY